MKKIAILVLAIAGLASIAATCVVRNTALTNIDGKMHYGAEMRNDTTINILDHEFLVAFIDQNGVVLDTKIVSGCLRSMQAGKSDFYSAQSSAVASQVKIGLSRMIIDQDWKVGTVTNGNLTFSDVSVVRNGATLTITGKLKNSDSDRLEDARVCAVVRNNGGDVVRVQRDNDQYDLNPSQEVTFSITIVVPDSNTHVHRVDLWADALNDDEGDKPTEPKSSISNAANTATPTVTGTPPTSTPTGTPPTSTPTPPAPTATHTPLPPTPTNTPVGP